MGVIADHHQIRGPFPVHLGVFADILLSVGVALDEARISRLALQLRVFADVLTETVQSALFLRAAPTSVARSGAASSLCSVGGKEVMDEKGQKPDKQLSVNMADPLLS